MLLMTLLFALAVSMDGFGVGLTYGFRKIKVPLKSMAIIFLVSAVMISISMGFGQLITSFIPTSLTLMLSALLLMTLGCWILFKSWIERKKGGIKEEVMVFKWSIPSLGIAIQILCEPDLADADASGIISTWEAFYLGIALALDAFGAGLALSMAGFSIALTMLTVGICQCIMLFIGIHFGKIGVSEYISGKVAYIPGVILILLGIWKIT